MKFFSNQQADYSFFIFFLTIVYKTTNFISLLGIGDWGLGIRLKPSGFTQ
jgi:hypothetical protein